MSRAAAPRMRVLFRVAAGSKQGFGHLVRARVLARALQIGHPLVAVRGGAGASAAAGRLGFRVVEGTARQLLDAHRPSVVVIDDPTAAHGRRWVSAARRRGIPTASVHDLGRGFCDADLSVDGSLVRMPWPRRGRQCVGPRFAILDPRVATVRGLRRDPRRVLIALGGGPRSVVAARIAAAIVRRRPDLTVRIAAGFVPREGRASRGIRWLPPQPGLALELARCSAAVLGGGISLYEAAAIGTPAAGWPVVAAQQPTVRALARAAGVVPILPGPRRVERAAAAIVGLLDQPPAPSYPIDGRGAGRVAGAIRELVSTSRGGGR